MQKAQTALVRRTARLGGGLLLLAGATVVILGQGAAASQVRSLTTRPSSFFDCPSIVATPWQAPYPPYPKGDKYDVTVNKYSCTEADHYVRILTANKVFKTPSFMVPPPSNVKGGPKSWTCRSLADKSGRAYDGECATYKAGLVNQEKPWFAWTVG